MACKPKHKMPVEDRAKQFMPFAALKGLPDALAARERIIVPKTELSEEMAQELDRRMHSLSKGKIASVVYFHRDKYIKITGMVARIDETSRILQIVNTKIDFDDIVEISDCPEHDDPGIC
ncbi:MAG: YolD-like family protein [Lachnospiraceae bacterium]|nr:YolD-like family protein [Lachnospiraceae bacterium]